MALIRGLSWAGIIKKNADGTLQEKPVSKEAWLKQVPLLRFTPFKSQMSKFRHLRLEVMIQVMGH